jgi:hypothetical protein
MNIKVKQAIKEKEDAQKLLAAVPLKDAFHCHDGQVLRNMKELDDALCVMTDETYFCHWNTKKKEFSNWVRNTIGDVKLATDLEKATSPSLAAWEVATRISYLARQLP